MNEYEAVRIETVGDYRISIYYDSGNDCPCTEWCMSGLFIWGGYGRDCDQLSPACNWRELFGKHDDGNHTVCDALRELIAKHVSQRKLLNYLKREKLGSVTFEYNRYLNIWEEVGHDDRNEYLWSLEFSPRELKEDNYIYELTEYMSEEQLAQILYDLAKDLAFTEWSSTGYGQGDYVHGYAFCTEERFAETCDRNTKNWKARVEPIMEAEAEDIGRWMWGDIFGFKLEKKDFYEKVYPDGERDREEGFDWVDVDSCWGYYCDPDELIEEVIREHDLRPSSAA